MRVTLGNSRSFTVRADQFILEAALDAKLNLPHSCKGGNCGACRAQLLSGEIHYPNGAVLGLSAAQAAGGSILLCQAFARSDLRIDIQEIHTAGSAMVKRLPCRIERAEPMSHDVMGLYLRLPAAEDFDFKAGQYIDILLPGDRRRSFSIASTPSLPATHRLLELHVRRVDGGEFSEQLFNQEARGALLSIEGPLGNFSYRPAIGAPLLFVGGGTGLAPCLSIMRHLIESRIEHDMALYWGVRSERDLYARREIESLLQCAPRLRFVPVLSEASVSWPGARGLVHEVVLVDLPDLREYEVYAAGAPVMIDALRRDFTDHGADPLRIYVDSFDYATDGSARQRSSSDTKS